MLEWTNGDKHPDASACRLKISLATAASRQQMPVPWNENEQYKTYLRCLSLISADCRLQLEEEKYFLDGLDHTENEVLNRLSVIKAAERPRSKELVVEVSFRKSETSQCFDALVDDTCLKSGNTAVAGGSLSLSSYTPPADGFGTGSLRYLNQLVGKNELSLTGISVSGILGTSSSSSFCGFVLCYELLCGHLRLKILEGDSPKYLGNMLFRALPLKETLQRGILCSILRVLLRNPEVGDELPGYFSEFMKNKEAHDSKTPTGFFGQVQGMFQGSFDSAKQNAAFLESVCKVLLEKNKARPLIGPFQSNSYIPSTTIRILFEGADFSEARNVCYLISGLTIPDKAKISCSERHFSPVDLGDGLKFESDAVFALSSAPLKSIGLEKYIRDIRAIQAPQDPEGGTSDISKLRNDFFALFQIQNSPACLSQNSQGIVDRLARDWDLSRRIEQLKIPNELLGFFEADIKKILVESQQIAEAKARIRKLRDALQSLYDADISHSQRCIDALLSTTRTASSDSDSLPKALFSLAHHAGQAPCCSFEFFAGLILDKDFDTRLTEINPFLNPNLVVSLENLLVGALLCLSRAGLAARGLAMTTEVNDFLERLSNRSETDRASLFDDLSLKCTALAELLATRRGYTKVEAGGKATYDPRFLLFEFTSNVILRDAQIALINRFVAAFQAGGSLCHQLIMGAGKTTVIAPLLSLILGTSSRLVVQVPRDILMVFRSKELFFDNT